MKREYKLYLMGILILAFGISCGQSVKETVKPVTPATAGGQFKRVVIVPLADYTKASSLEDYCRRNTLVNESLQDAFYRAGFISAAEEDVVQYLVDRGVIQAAKRGSGSSRTAAIDQELREGWSDEMKEELQGVIKANMTSESGSDQDQKTIALDRKILAGLAETFGADYVVRGRIIEFNSGQTDSFNPIRTGLIPMVFNSGQRTFLGVAESEGYEKIDTDLTESYNRMRAFGWGLGGALTGLIGDRQGRVTDITVQVRLLVQNPKTGEVLWLNRAEACARPSSAFADQGQDALTASAIEQVANSLVADFASAYGSGRIPITVKQVAAPEAEEKVITPPDEEVSPQEAMDARDAAEQAIQAAEESKAYAQQAENAAAEAKDSVKKASEATKKSEKIFDKIIAK